MIRQHDRRKIILPYTIKQMSELTGLPASTLRYYDKEGLLPSLRRNENNVRIFTEDDYHTLRLIECLKKSGLLLREIKEYMTMARKGNDTLKGRLAIFYRRRKMLKKEMKNLLDVMSVIEYKCWYYEQACEAGTEEAVKNLSVSDIPEKLRKAREILRGSITE